MSLFLVLSNGQGNKMAREEEEELGHSRDNVAIMACNNTVVAAAQNWREVRRPSSNIVPTEIFDLTAVNRPPTNEPAAHEKNFPAPRPEIILQPQ